MSEITSGVLATALSNKMIQEQFDIVRPDINGLLALASFGEPIAPSEGSKITWLDMSVGADSLTMAAAATDSATTLTVTDGSKARKGMLLLTTLLQTKRFFLLNLLVAKKTPQQRRTAFMLLKMWKTTSRQWILQSKCLDVR